MSTKVEKLEFEGSQYEVIPPLPTSTERGGIIASAKTSDYTTEVKLGSDGKLYVPEGGGVGSLSDLGITTSASRLNKTAAYFRNDDKTITDIETAGAVYVTSLDDSTTMPIVASEFETSSGHRLSSKLNSSDLYRGVFNNGNLDELKAAGMYWLQILAEVTGTKPMPDGNFGYLEIVKVAANSSDCMQRFTHYYRGDIYTRVFVNGGWQPWKLVPVMTRGGYGGNIDELTTCGYYYVVSNSVTGTFPPSGSYGIIEVFRHDAHGLSATVQRFTSCATGEIWHRFYMGGWQPWEKIGGGGGSWTYTKVVDSKYVGTVSTPVSSHQYFTAKGTVNGNVFTNTINLGDIGLWGSKSFSFAHGSSSCNFDITASSIKVTPSGSVDDVSGYYMDK